MRNAVAIYPGMYFSQRGCGATIRPTTTIQAAQLLPTPSSGLRPLQSWHDHTVHFKTHQVVRPSLKAAMNGTHQCDFHLLLERPTVTQLADGWLRALLLSTLLGWLIE